MRTGDSQRSGILLADKWKLVPVDARNWELCELREIASTSKSVESGTAGTTSWRPCGRYYQHSTIDQAMLYVLDQLAKEGATDQMLALASAMKQWQEGVARLEGAMKQVMGE